MRFGYSAWGYLGDHKFDRRGNPVSTPDGNASYSWSILHETQRRGWETYWMQQDRDWFGYSWKHDLFSSFNRLKRQNAYLDVLSTVGPEVFSEREFPDLDILLLEWRFPIPGRNCFSYNESVGVTTFDGTEQDPDLKRQFQLLDYYKNKKTKIIVWDLDHKLDERSEREGSFRAVFETSTAPRQLFLPRIRVEPPTVVADLLEHPTLPSDPDQAISYVGSRYERDDVIEEWIGPYQRAHPGRTHFYGNWSKTIDDCRARWPGIVYHDRIGMSEFRKAYGTACSVPLLAKRSYLETGFITPRIWEALLFGSIPVGLGTHNGIARYLPDRLIARDPGRFGEIVEELAGLDVSAKDRLRRDIVDRISFMDVANFVDAIERT